MQARYFYPYWGSESIPFEEVLATIKTHGFEGIEINLPEDENIIDQLLGAGEDGLVIMGQQVLGHRDESPSEYLKRAIDRLDFLKQVRPHHINSHTGKDHFSFEDNCAIIEELENWSEKNGIPVFHEIHRGRFSFHPKTIVPYLQRFPSLKLVADYSHWCAVSESLLEDQQAAITRVLAHISHVHARVGWSQSAQVYDPFAPEWAETLSVFTHWWQQIIDYRKGQGKTELLITPEYGPFPYMADRYQEDAHEHQKGINLKMKSHLQQVLAL